jgi:hypothetical protein
MNWKLKAILQKILSQSRVGDKINHWNAASGKDYYPNGITYHFSEFFQKFRLVNNFTKESFPNRNALEIGTGYFMVEPLLLSLLGFKQVFTVDISKDVTLKTVRRTLDYLFTEKYLEEIKKHSSMSPEEIEKQIQMINQSHSLEELLRQSRIVYIAPYQSGELVLPDMRFDWIFSQVVFEHIPPQKLEKLFAVFQNSIADDGAMVHTINFIDHFTNPGFWSDREISEFNFLKFSDAEWNFWAGNDIAYTNRLSHLFYFELAERHGFTVEKFEGTNYREKKNFSAALIHDDVIRNYQKAVDRNDLLKYQRGIFLYKKDDSWIAPNK